MIDVATGTLLIADPFLKDPNFMRTVIFLCEHQQQGSIGFVMNRKLNKTIGDLISDLEQCNYPVYFGGPVQTNTIHFLHRCPDLITDGIEIIDNIFWGGDFDKVAELIKINILKPNMIRFYIGYSGWNEAQLQNEIKQNSWLVTNGNRKLVFHHNENLIWKDALKQLGGKYEQLINYPIDPQLN
ncbi:MAG: YqgE/AlgH family protein [Chitinophagaceae bacterium]